MQYVINDSTQGICPDGWHIPSDEEWEELAQYISNDNGGYSKFEGNDDGLSDDWNEVGGHLKSTSGWDSGGNGTDDYDFEALPGGILFLADVIDRVGNVGRFWSSTKSHDGNSYTRKMNNSSSNLYRKNDVGYDYDGYGLSVRCIKDE